MTTTLSTWLSRVTVTATSNLQTLVFKRLKFTGLSDRARELRKLTSLPYELHQAVIGMLLSDAGCYRTKGPTSNSRLEWSFGQHRADLAQFIYDLLKDYVQTPVSTLFTRPNAESEPILSHRLKTLALPVFNFYRELFYKLNPVTGKYVKIVPLNIEELLTPIALAFIIMGDGNYKDGAVRIYTNGFTHEDNLRLVAAMQHVFGIKVRVKHDRKNQYILVINSSELRQLQQIVLPHMHSSMLYRIGL